MEEPYNTEKKRNPDGTFAVGTGAGPGRPKGKTLKEYQAERFRGMSDEEKEEWLKDIAKIEKWRMSEGNPESKMEAKVEGNLIIQTVSYADNNNSPQVSTENIPTSTS